MYTTKTATYKTTYRHYERGRASKHKRERRTASPAGSEAIVLQLLSPSTLSSSNCSRPPAKQTNKKVSQTIQAKFVQDRKDQQALQRVYSDAMLDWTALLSLPFRLSLLHVIKS